MADYHFGPLYRLIEDIAMYVESGYLDVLTAAPCLFDTARPAILRYSAATSGYISTTNTPLQGAVTLSTDENLDEFPFSGQALGNGSESLAVGCVFKLQSVTDQCGNTYTGGGFCNIGLILAKKRVISLVPSSMFSGKLRLLIQSVYGSQRNDISLVEAEGFVLPGKLRLAGFQLSAFYSPSYGLYTTPDFNYFLVEVTNDVKYYPLILSDTAQQYAALLADHPRKTEKAFAKRVEAYILSTAKVDEDNVIVGGSLSGLNGEPLSYGWHWSWDGRQADIVLHAEDIVNHRYTVTRYKLLITRTDGVFSETLSIEDTGYWWPQLGGLNIFVPDYFANKALVKIPVVEELNNGIPVPGTEGAAPVSSIHCLRTMSDELTVIRHASNLTIKTNEESIVGDPGCTNAEKLDQLFQINNGVFGTTMLQIGSDVYNGLAASTRNKSEVNSYPDGDPTFSLYDFSTQCNYSHQFDPMCGGMTLRDYLVSTGKFAIVNGVLSAGSSGTTEVGGQTYQNVYGLAHFDQSRHREIEQSTSDLFMSTEIFIQLPFYDCTSLIWAYRSINIVDDRRTGVELSRTIWGGTSIWDFHYDGSNYQPFAEVVPVYPAQVGNLAGLSITWGPYEDIDSRIGYANLYRYSGGDSSELIYTEADTSPLGSYFDIDYFTNPYVEQFDWVKSDTSGGFKWGFRATLGDDAKYPADSAVGWA